MSIVENKNDPRLIEYNKRLLLHQASLIMYRFAGEMEFQRRKEQGMMPDDNKGLTGFVLEVPSYFGINSYSIFLKAYSNAYSIMVTDYLIFMDTFEKNILLKADRIVRSGPEYMADYIYDLVFPFYKKPEVEVILGTPQKSIKYEGLTKEEELEISSIPSLDALNLQSSVQIIVGVTTIKKLPTQKKIYYDSALFGAIYAVQNNGVVGYYNNGDGEGRISVMIDEIRTCEDELFQCLFNTNQTVKSVVDLYDYKMSKMNYTKYRNV